jgi:hypothetical protein
MCLEAGRFRDPSTGDKPKATRGSVKCVEDSTLGTELATV